MENLRLIALDLDGTTLNSQGHLSRSTQTALEQAIRRGIHVVIASGRAKNALPQDIFNINGLEYAITSNGSSIFYLPENTRIFARDMQPETVNAVLEIAADIHFPFEAFIEGKAYTPQAYFNCPTDFGVPERMNRYVQSTRIPVPSMADFIRQHIHEIEGMDMIIPDPDQKKVLSARLAAVPDLYITSSESYYLEMAAGSVSKASALQALADKLQILPEQALAFGDGGNDLEMLKWAGCGVAMKNAAPILLAAADDVTLSNDEDGVAYYIENIFNCLP